MLLYYQYNVATRFTQVQQVSIRLYSKFVTDMSWTNCYHVNTEFNDNYCYWYLFQLFPSVNHANQFLYVYLDVKFASSKHYSCLLFGSFRIHEGNNYVYLSRYYWRGSCHSLSAMFLRQFLLFCFLHEIFKYYFSSVLHCQNFVATVYAMLHFFDITVLFFSYQ